MRTTLLNTVTLVEMNDLIRKSFVMNQQMVKPVASQIFINADLTANTGNTKRFDEVDTETFGRLKREGMDAAKASVGIGYNKTMTFKRIAMEIDITWENRRYNEDQQVTGKLTNLSHFAEQRTELDLAHRLTFCASSTYTDMDGDTVTVTGGDSLPIVYATHTLKYSSTTWRNRVANDPVFSKSAIQAAETLFNTDILSNFGERRIITPNTIVTGDDPETVNNVMQFLQSTSDSEQNNAGVVNVYKAKYRHLVLPYLATTAVGANDSTKRRWWFLAGIGQGVNGFQAYYGVSEATNLKTPSAGNNGEDAHNDNWTYGVRKSYGIVVVSARGLVGSLPTS